MDKYTVVLVPPKIYASFANIYKNKYEYSPSGANNFRLAYKKSLKELETFPESGSNHFVGYKTKVIKGCLLAYTIDKKSKTVYVFDIVDPTMDTTVRKYRSQ